MPTGANAYANRDRYLHTYGDRDRYLHTYGDRDRDGYA
jgi:hypothetical protein